MMYVVAFLKSVIGEVNYCVAQIARGGSDSGTEYFIRKSFDRFCASVDLNPSVAVTNQNRLPEAVKDVKAQKKNRRQLL